MKKILILIPVIFLTFGNCTKEPAIVPSAKFTTSLVNNTITKSTQFWLYLNQTEGEFITFFKGDALKRTYKKGDNTRTGTAVDTNIDSVQISYGVVGEFTLTVLAKSYGNWGDEELEAVDSVRITVE